MTRKAMVLAMGAILATTMLGGCPFLGDSRTTNQGGGNLISAGLKIVGGRLTTVTPDELQVITDFISDAVPNIQITLGDDEAAAATDFLDANNVNNLDDIQRLVDQAERDPTSIEIPDSIRALIESGIDFNQIVSAE